VAGQIIKRGERNFIVRIYQGRDAEGKRSYLNRTVKGTKKEAQAVLNKLLRDKDLGLLIEATRMTLNEYLDHWLETAVKPRVRERTHKEYCNTMRRYVRDSLGPKRLSSIKPVDIQALYSTMQENGLKNSVRYVHTILKDALTQAVKWQMLPQNPAMYVDLPRRDRTEMLAMNQEEAERFRGAAKHTKWYVLFSLMLGTGLRPSEALALRWKDIDLGKGRLTVQRSVAFVNKRWVFEEPKSKSSRRTIPLPLGLVQELSEYMTHQLELGFNELVFCNADGNPVHEKGISHWSFKPALRRAGLNEKIRMYDLRHTHATLLLLAGVHPKIVSERLGHSSIGITLDTYSHVLPNMQQEAAEKLDAMLYSEPAGAHATRETN
jgi:integrase